MERLKMIEIVGIGANVCDTLLTVDTYPKEDTKKRAEAITLSGGGPCATGLCCASKLGAKCGYLGTFTDDTAGEFLQSDIKKYGVSLDFSRKREGYNSFTSYILISKDMASRTCVFHKGDIPEGSLDAEQIGAIKDAKLLLIDGNDMTAAREAVKIARESGTLVLYDAGGRYEGVESLLEYTDVLIPSEEFALSITDSDSAESAARILYEKYSPKVVVITQGKDGGVIYDGNTVKKYPAFKVEAKDSNGAGDVFHGAFSFALVRGMDYYSAAVFSSAVSAIKCTSVGARAAVPSYDQAINFLKERGYEL